MSTARRLVLLAIAVGLAAFFRLYQLDTVPPGFFIDEAQDALDARAIQVGERFPVVAEVGEVKGRSREAMFYYLMAGVFAVEGPSVHSARLTIALIGIATVAAFLLLAEQVIGARRAFVAAVLLAVCRWHVTISRIAVRGALTPLFIVLTLLALLRLARRRTASAAVLFGAVLGAGFYTYFAFWVVPVALCACAAAAAACGAFRPRRADLALGLTALAAFLTVTAPLIHYAATKPDYYFARALNVSSGVRTADDRFAALSDHAQRALFMLHLRGDPSPVYNIPGRPLLDPLMGVAFLVGLVWLLRRLPRQPLRSFAVLCFWLLPLAPAAAAYFDGAALRAVGAVSAVCLIAAMGFDAAARRLLPGVAGWRRAARTALLCILLVAVAALNYRDYFRDFASRTDIAGAYGLDVERFYAFCADLAARYDVYLSPVVGETPNFRFMPLEHPAELRPFASAADLTAADPPARDRVFVSDSPPLNAVLRRIYPHHEELARYALWGRRDGVVLRVPRDELPAALADADRREAEFWLRQVQADFEAQSRDW